MKSFTTCLCGLLIIAATICQAQDAAVQDAIDLLRKRRAEITDADRVTKIDRAIDSLLRSDDDTPTVARRISYDDDATPSVANVSINDFMDYTQQYKDQTVTMLVYVRSNELIGPGLNLRQLLGGTGRFLAVGEDGNRLDLRVELPKGLELPKVGFGDRVVVEFRCGEGSLQRGNQAISIKRPSSPLVAR